MRLAPAAAVVLRGLPVAYWGDLADAVELEVVMAEVLLVDGQPPQTCLQIDLLTRDSAEVDATPLSSQATVIETIAPRPITLSPSSGRPNDLFAGASRSPDVVGHRRDRLSAVDEHAPASPRARTDAATRRW